MNLSTFKVNAMIYIFSSTLNLSIPFLLLPILTRELGVEEYGKIGLFQTFIALFLSLISLGTTSFVMREYFESKKCAFKAVRTVIIISIFTSIIIAAVILPLSKLINFSLEIEYVLIAIFCALLSIINIIRQTIYQAAHYAMRYAIFQISQALLSFAFTMLLIYTVFDNAESRIYAILSTFFIYAMYSLITIYRESRDFSLPNIGVKDFKGALGFGLPLLPHLFGAFCLSYLDRFIIVKLLDFEQLGYYLIAVQLSTLFGFLLDSIQKSYIPYIYEKIKQKQITKDIIIKSIYYILFLYLFPFLFFFLGDFFIYIYVGEGYSYVANILFFLILGQALRGGYLILSAYISYYRKNALQSFLTISSGVLNILLMYFFIERYGVIGAAYSNAIAMFCLFLLTGAVSMKFVALALRTES